MIWPRLVTYGNLMVMVKGSDAGGLMRMLDDGKNTKDGKPGKDNDGPIRAGGPERDARLRQLQQTDGLIRPLRLPFPP